MSVESDGIGESLDEQIRMGTMAAMQVGQAMAQARAERMRRTQEESQQRAQELQRRMEAERRAAVAELSVVQNSDWWRDATPDDVADKYATAHAWKDEDPEIARHEERMRRELQERYGIDPNRENDGPVDSERLSDEMRRVEERQADPQNTDVEAEAAQAERRAGVADERARESYDRAAAESDPEQERRLRDQAEQERAEADRLNADAQNAYDSPERRDANAERMREAGGDPAQIDTATRADQAQGRPAQDAVRNPPGRAASQPHGRSNAAQRGRGPQRVR